MVSVSVPKTFKTAARASVAESLFSKVTGKTSAFHNFAEEPITCIGLLRKVALLEISINYLLTVA